jgi:hypothetical protein
MGKELKPARGMTTKSKEALAKEIVKLWDDACKDGLDGKKLHADVRKAFEQKFLDHVLDKLVKDKEVFTDEAKKNTKRVAKDLGKVCKMMTRDSEKTISLDTFQKVFKMMKGHPACPDSDTLGAGTWCDVPIV